MTAWVDEMLSLDASEKYRKTLDILFTNLDKLHIEGKFQESDEVIRSLNFEKLSVTLIVGILTITLPAKDKLNNRESFFNKAEAFFKETEPERAYNLLRGLK